MEGSVQGSTSHDAEVEAVARAVYETYDAAKRKSWEALRRDNPEAAHQWRTYAEKAIAALDAVRAEASDV